MNKMVESPPHYNSYNMEVIDMMERIWGLENLIMFCEINAFKYRMRLGLKDSMDQDFAKEQWYIKKAQQLRERLKNNEEQK